MGTISLPNLLRNCQASLAHLRHDVALYAFANLRHDAASYAFSMPRPWHVRTASCESNMNRLRKRRQPPAHATYETQGFRE